MANILNGFLDNVVSGATNPKGDVGDFRHAAIFYAGDAFRLAPKVKFLYHVVFNINPNCPAIQTSSFRQQHMTSIGMLVKEVDLPKFKIQVETQNQYNRKKPVQTKLEYDPVQLVLHDDNLGVSTQLWSLYYSYYNADPSHAGSIGSGDGAARASSPSGIIGQIAGAIGGGAGALVGAATSLLGGGLGPSSGPSTSGSSSATTPAAFTRTAYKGMQNNGYNYGLDNGQTEPFFNSIQIFQLSRKTYQAFTLVNPLITAWQHDRMAQSADGEVVQSTMQIAYEAVFYGTGPVSEGTPKGFATEYYDKTPSPLGIAGGGTTSVFGTGGILDGAGSILDALSNPDTFKDPGKLLGAAISGANLVNNAKKLTKEGLRQEGANILTGALNKVAQNGIGSVIPGTVFPKTIGAGQSEVTKAIPRGD